MAEVLITLGIVGVVAALTIPGIISSYRKQVLETRLSKLVSSVNQAVKRSEADNDECQYWSFGDENNHRDAEIMKQWWKKYLQNYVPYEIAAEISASENSGNGGYKVYFKNGSALRLEALTKDYARIVLYPDAKITGKFLIDVNDKAGKDYFLFVLSGAYSDNNKCVLRPPVYIDMTNDMLKDACLKSYNGFVSTNAAGGHCAELIRRNGWKIPKDYPIKL